MDEANWKQHHKVANESLSEVSFSNGFWVKHQLSTEVSLFVSQKEIHDDVDDEDDLADCEDDDVVILYWVSS